MFKSSIKRGIHRHAPVQRQQTPRREKRHEVQKSASVGIIETGESISCTIRDIHTRGARISVISPERIPNKVLITSRSDGLETLGEIVWRKGNEIGVKFVAR